MNEISPQLPDDIKALVEGLKKVEAYIREQAEKWTTGRPRPDLAANVLAAADALERQMPAGWQPIETAPRNGTHFLGLSPSYGPVEALFDGTYNDGEPAWVAYWADQEVQPTHWMPLPTPPSEGGEK